MTRYVTIGNFKGVTVDFFKIDEGGMFSLLLRGKSIVGPNDTIFCDSLLQLMRSFASDNRRSITTAGSSFSGVLNTKSLEREF